MPNESIDDFLNKFKSIANNLQSLGKVTACFEKNNKVLRSLSTEYNNAINSIEIYKDINTMHFQKLMRILKNAKIKMNFPKKENKKMLCK